MKTFRVHGLNLASAIELPELASLQVRQAMRPDAIVTAGDVPATLDGAIETEDGFVIAGASILIDVDGIGRFLVEDGCRISVDAAPDTEPEAVRAFFYGAALSALLQQLGLMPLHASAAAIDAAGVAFLGTSGQGKSTLAAAFAQRGFKLLSDDKLVVRQTATGIFVTPSPPLVSLYPPAAHANGFAAEQRVAPTRRFGKHSYLASAQFLGEPRPLNTLYVLEWGAADVAPSIEPLTPFEALVALRANLNLGSLVVPLGLETEFIDWAQAMVAAVSTFRLVRPRDLSRIGSVVDAVVEHERARHG